VKPGASSARGLCGALVGLFSWLLTTAAHVFAGGDLPGGSGAVFLGVVCAGVGAAAGAGPRDGRAHPAHLAIGILAGQTLGHLVMTLTAHHGHGDAWPSLEMALVHGAAAVMLGVLISLVGHLDVVCASVLSSLRLVVVHRGRARSRRWPSTPSQMRRRLLAGVTRMRAPPNVVAFSS